MLTLRWKLSYWLPPSAETICDGVSTTDCAVSTWCEHESGECSPWRTKLQRLRSARYFQLFGLVVSAVVAQLDGIVIGAWATKKAEPTSIMALRRS